MLVDPKFTRPQRDMALVLSLCAGSGPVVPERVAKGVYRAGHWNVEDLVKGGVKNYWDDDSGWPDFKLSGVCDNYEQPIERFNLEKRPEPLFVSFVEIGRDEQPRSGGWRWRKWGEYIGTREPQCEYLHDEPEIERVFTFRIHEPLMEWTP